MSECDCFQSLEIWYFGSKDNHDNQTTWSWKEQYFGGINKFNNKPFWTNYGEHKKRVRASVWVMNKSGQKITH